MSNHTFLKDYANMYDLFYKNKDYDKEVDFLDKVFNAHKVFTVLDIACGTGEHIIRLGKLGYEVRGRDISESMIKIAKGKSDIPFEVIDMNGDWKDNFVCIPYWDAIICMFSSIGYLEAPYYARRVFYRAFEHLFPGGIFVFDFWNKVCVLKNYNSYRKHDHREAFTSIDGDTAKIEMVFGSAKQTETHYMRFFDPKSLELLLREVGFSVKMFPMMEPDKKITDEDWSIQAICLKPVWSSQP
jgi:SAM-dependent methyltransferase